MLFWPQKRHEGDLCTFETLCLRFAINDSVISQIAEMVHDADLEDEKFGRKEAIGIDLMLKGLAHMEKSSNEILSTGIAAFEAFAITITTYVGNREDF